MPKTIDTDVKSVGGPRYMRAIVSLDDVGNMQVRTNTFVHIDLAGFTGGVIVSLSDASGQLLYVTPIVQYGVDGRFIFWSQSDRWDNELLQRGPDIARRTARIDVWLGWAPKNRLLTDLVIVATTVVEIVLWLIENWPEDDQGQTTENRPVQSTYQALTAQRGELQPGVEPTSLPFDQPSTFTVTATDSISNEPVPGVVYKAMSLPLDRAGSPLGAVGSPITATVSGQWISQRRISVDPDTGRPTTEVVRVFVQERLYVRTADYGDVAVPFTLTGAPADDVN